MKLKSILALSALTVAALVTAGISTAKAEDAKVEVQTETSTNTAVPAYAQAEDTQRETLHHTRSLKERKSHAGHVVQKKVETKKEIVKDAAKADVKTEADVDAKVSTSGE